MLATDSHGTLIERSVHEREPVILLYHGVTDAPSHGIENFSRKHVPLDVFDRHCSFLSAECNVVPLDELIDRACAGDPLPPRSVAITFDDGYRNNLTTALPCLDRYGLPATIYVVTGLLGTRRLFWTDIVEDVVNRTVAVELHVTLAGREFSYGLSDAAARVAAVVGIKAHLKVVDSGEKDSAVDELCAACGVDWSEWSATNYEVLSREELAKLARSSLITIGAHTVEHVVLSRVDTVRQEYEVRTSKRALEEVLDRPVDHFAFPEGREIDYSANTVQVVRESGYRTSVTAEPGTVRPGTSCFEVPRLFVGYMDSPFPLYKEDRPGFG